MKLVLVKDIDGNEIQILPNDIPGVGEKNGVTEVETKDGYILTKSSAQIVRNALFNALYL